MTRAIHPKSERNPKNLLGKVASQDTIAALLAVALVVPLQACEDTRTAPDASSVGAVDGSAPDRDGGVDRDAGTDAGPGGIARSPDIPLVNGGDPSWDILEFEAFNIVPDDIGRITEMFAVVRNNDPTLTVCSLSPDVYLIDSSGTDLGFIGLTVVGTPMLSAIVADCVPPGGIGLAYGNASGARDLDVVTRLDVRWFGAGTTTAVPYGNVAIEGATVVDPFGGGFFYALEGILRVSSGTIQNPSVHVVPRVAGLPIAQLRDIELGTFGAGSTIPFTTTSTDIPFTDYLVALSYRGPSPLLVDSPEVREALVARDRFDVVRRANEQRQPLPR